MQNSYVAHCRKKDKETQSVKSHLEGVAVLAKTHAAKIGLEDAGEILGLLHDIGKYSSLFQCYIQSATEILNPDIDDDFVEMKSFKGKIDHSTAGARWIWERLGRMGVQGKLVGQILAVCIASHHGGMLDCLQKDGKNGFLKRMNKDDELSHHKECLENGDADIFRKLEEIATEAFVKIFFARLVSIAAPQKKEPSRLKHFRIGFLVRFLFSCLIDADRIDSADFESPENEKLRKHGKVDWQIAIDRLEKKVASFEIHNQVDVLRNRISQHCLDRAMDNQGIYTLTVPTGGGKTFSSFRYALHHAKKHGLDRIIYIIPYTSIIEQNAQVIRDVLERGGDEFPWVLEHHSNLEPESQTWHSKLSAENWDAPVIFTTMVQFLEVMFGGGTRGPRRLHNLANTVIIFDEIQTLPVNCVHPFCNGLQFLVDHARATAVLCTATQPLMDKEGINPDFGALSIPDGNELAGDVTRLFRDLKRVEIINRIRLGGWHAAEIAELAVTQVRDRGNCLVIVNTKAWARMLYEKCQAELGDGEVFHLSTSLCPAHRKEILARVIDRLDNDRPVLCISTQLIEAGVDIDFNCVIRFLAGLDSIAQAAGRCNRNGNNDVSQVYVVNPAEEAIRLLKDIEIGRDTSMRVLGESEHEDFLSPSAMNRYFAYYFYRRAKQMVYPLTAKQAGREDTLVNLLTDNPLNIGREKNPQKAIFQLQQSFKTAGNAFKAINAPTQAVIVQYGKGKDVVARLCAEFEPANAYDLLKKAQKYSVNVFPNVWDKLKKEKAVYPVQAGEGMYYLDERYYSDEFGVSTEEVNTMGTHIV
jgi:CRISPR-associated endonuclease/helicase Cas3